MNTSIITEHRREKLAKITSGAILSISKITHIAIGDGGCDNLGEPISPNNTATSLNNEIARYVVDEVAYPNQTTARYKATIPKNELVGKSINELALVDADGLLCAIKTMYSKIKDDNVTFTFTFDDEF